jgi:hypothetical protein
MRRPLALSLATAAAFMLACGGGDDTPDTPKRGTKGAAQAQPKPLQGKSKKQICSDPSLALAKWGLDDLQADFGGICCGGGGLPADSMECNLDWPFSDVPPCEAWARMRNGVYARYGYPFQNGKWKREFEGKSWYTRRDDFDPSWLSGTATANIQRLKENETMKVACSP